MDYVKNIERDEIRSGFLVTSQQKRAWNFQIGLILEFARICEKYDLKWFAFYGTLLGTVRHGGFIPWDGDVDLVMFRPDYEKFKQVARQEIRFPFYFDLWYENEESIGIPPETFPYLPFIKLRDMRTLIPEVNEYIAIDIFPIDSSPPFDSDPNRNSLDLKFREIYEIYFAACHTKFVREELAHPTGEFMLGRETVQRIFDLPLKTRGKLLEEEATRFYHESENVSVLIHLSTRIPVQYKRSDFDETIYLPFEEISLPAPKNFDAILTAYYGDWRKIYFKGMYSPNHSVDISLDRYSAEKDLPDDLNDRSNSLRSRFHLDEIRAGIFVGSSHKKIWRTQLELLAELKRVCEKFGLKFWATSSTLFAAIKFHGFNPEDDFLTLEMTRSDLEKLEFNFPFRLIQTSDEKFELHDERTSMIRKLKQIDRPQGIFIEIKPTENPPDEIEWLPFEFTSIPVPKNYDEILTSSIGDYKNARVQRFFDFPISADISYKEMVSKLKRVIHYHSATLTDLENPTNCANS